MQHALFSTILSLTYRLSPSSILLSATRHAFIWPNPMVAIHLRDATLARRYSCAPYSAWPTRGPRTIARIGRVVDFSRYATVIIRSALDLHLTALCWLALPTRPIMQMLSMGASEKEVARRSVIQTQAHGEPST